MLYYECLRIFQFKYIVDSVTNCWNWTGAKEKAGYGSIRYNGKSQRASRLSWLLTFRPIPDELFILHECDNPSCINPEHLFLGTHQDNMQDMTRKGRHGSLVLTSIKSEEIRAKYATGLYSQRDLAKEYKVSQATIRNHI